MNKILYVFIALICALVIFNSCEDIVVKDISNESLDLIGPPTELVASSQTFTFWWNELDGASNYQLLIVSPDKVEQVSVSLDTLLTTNKYSFLLPKGKYEWCVRAINSGYKTQYFCRKITVN